ncbi:isoprenylcysteine carboxylmethyltransferase family protein [Flavobacterium sp. HXWNR69]|uniref:Isoprenylcysteine carboxylmethyltransferase family protein n=1 Tax=Flavobacterium fragile TaxID=2949085 RepID=A0ABT0THS5_9FLAO|nr:isoprenylcysteine carboxylmethyltransferase family protein [Flavobacterium sp. HXWNR69]MCL9770530.1 isoprenylcysteine carboxylmethyltransferase family protein [Flavobacterium sp. HXWNR69]
MKKSLKDYIFVSIQFLLFGLYAFEFLAKLELPLLVQYFGLVVAFIGCLISIVSVVQLNTNLTVFPTPKSASFLITSGLYSFSRHPIYSGLILFTFGYSVYQSSIYKFIISLVLLILFYFKTQYEESQLQTKFHDYLEYKQKVGRFFSKIK